MTPGARIPKLAPSDLDDEQHALYDAITGGRRAQGPQLFRLADSEGCLEGPFNAFLLQPRLGSALQALGSSVRYETALSDRCREIAILVVAAHWQSDFEWYAHEAVARSAGLTDADLAAIRDGRYAELGATWDDYHAEPIATRDGRDAGTAATRNGGDTELGGIRDGRDAGTAATLDGRDTESAGREALVAQTAAALLTRGDLEDAEYLDAVEHLGPAGLFELLTLVGYYATLALQLRVFRVPAPDSP